ncbi:hypothetical protein [Xanthomonas phaseoli]|uniref:Uncharacterized protein n=1 Tax=Xanthomonas manihotis TaxID=43353 RepID=A0A8I2BU16_XANMN|nr:hypothetical protein [Xanthomonas phaseoli]KUF21301.1 hypothetical protein AO826_14370 [Xanthomonas phaseoli pv. manihotis]MBO9721175.1 hypothetical protein [Xanthomonas phaseoli pv. manihotis]MBO9756238.1 hypothetical protein [Xanthomonas phaseoli pv. manihotis]MBO9758728.1 hypothetical protein [Xanthomonas phaseoli pv. manihotis]MBO9763034.1 hypothetical protein [Xanthomonas phaseoli pv. manihotis]
MESLISAFDCLIAMAPFTLLRTPLTCTAFKVDAAGATLSALAAACCAAASQFRASPMRKSSGRYLTARRATDACCDGTSMMAS